MVTVGVLAHFEFKAGTEQLAEQFFRNGQLVVEAQPITTVWFAFRVGPTSYGAFAAFATEADRDALLSSGGPKMAAEHAAMFAVPPSFERVDIVASRQ